MLAGCEKMSWLRYEGGVLSGSSPLAGPLRPSHSAAYCRYADCDSACEIVICQGLERESVCVSRRIDPGLSHRLRCWSRRLWRLLNQLIKGTLQEEPDTQNLGKHGQHAHSTLGASHTITFAEQSYQLSRNVIGESKPIELELGPIGGEISLNQPRSANHWCQTLPLRREFDDRRPELWSKHGRAALATAMPVAHPYIRAVLQYSCSSIP